VSVNYQRRESYSERKLPALIQTCTQVYSIENAIEISLLEM
jgi:hypothetical protein